MEKSIKNELFREIENRAAMEFSRDLYFENEKITKFRFFLLTDAYNRQRAKTIKDLTINDRIVELNVWDIERLYDLVSSQTQKESVEINFADFGIEGIPCVKAVEHKNIVADIEVSPVYEENSEENNVPENIITYSSYLAVVSGEILNQLYLDYGAKLLEGNVRSFLSAKGKVRERKFDTVILDEASMASIPALWCASYLAEKNIVIVGDFLQLPPIVMAETPLAQKWLGQDIFHHSGMQALAKEEKAPSNFVMLNKQFRMESDIAELANNYYGDYGGLQSDDSNEKRVKAREEFYGWYSGKKKETNVHLIDTKNLHAWVTGVPQGKKHSRLNYFSASVCVELAFKFVKNKLDGLDEENQKKCEEPFVLIVAPYKPHTARIKQLIALEYENRGIKEDPG